jgi:15-cis-phytoene synthase
VVATMSGRDTSFYYSFLVLPARKRRAIVAVWDFCRAVDDAVDEAPSAEPGHPDSAPCRLESWHREIEACYAGRPQTPEGTALAPFIGRYSLPRDAFEAVFDGVAMDLERSRYQTFDELREYCLHVASAVGLLCISIFGYTDPRTRQYALDLGIALQLTNIVRDIRSDLARGRIYVPREDLERHSCAEDDLRAGVVTGPVRSLLAEQCDRAEGYYLKAERELPVIDRRAMVAARIMGGVYHAILERIVRSGYQVFGPKVRVPLPRRALIAAGIWLRTACGR